MVTDFGHLGKKFMDRAATEELECKNVGDVYAMTEISKTATRLTISLLFLPFDREDGRYVVLPAIGEVVEERDVPSK
ncbi:hypothetical protein GOBAR_AA20905 [Gossypium barbadense]|uniref:Uncharacterized protein n=1 Tax=Gossypium barbadense TaxID=3634 RepID=A0A2P5X8V8_GOSBA|nr:hypothetical protein GOBAR_AA20905 [Gossypium barbadense]